MIGLKAIILALVTFVPGYLVFRLGNFNKFNFKFLLIFSGAFLLSITILHIFPELYSLEGSLFKISVFVLIGIFLQMTLESFTSGIEHGHWHDHGLAGHSSTFPYGLTIALFLHSLIEGSILVQDNHMHSHGFQDSLLVGVAFHKIPAAIALISVLINELKNSKLSVILLLLFSIASPIGMIFSAYFQDLGLLSESSFNLIMALAAGSFIYISATILFEARRDHKIKLANVVPALIGALTALILELI